MSGPDFDYDSYLESLKLQMRSDAESWCPPTACAQGRAHPEKGWVKCADGYDWPNPYYDPPEDA